MRPVDRHVPDASEPTSHREPPVRPDAVIPSRGAQVGASADATASEPVGGSPMLRFLSIAVVVAMVLASAGTLLVTLRPGTVVMVAVAAIVAGFLVVAWLWRRARREPLQPPSPQPSPTMIDTRGTVRRG